MAHRVRACVLPLAGGPDSSTSSPRRRPPQSSASMLRAGVRLVWETNAAEGEGTHAREPVGRSGVPRTRWSRSRPDVSRLRAASPASRATASSGCSSKGSAARESRRAPLLRGVAHVGSAVRQGRARRRCSVRVQLLAHAQVCLLRCKHCAATASGVSKLCRHWCRTRTQLRRRQRASRVRLQRLHARERRHHANAATRDGGERAYSMHAMGGEREGRGRTARTAARTYTLPHALTMSRARQRL